MIRRGEGEGNEEGSREKRRGIGGEEREGILCAYLVILQEQAWEELVFVFSVLNFVSDNYKEFHFLFFLVIWP